MTQIQIVPGGTVKIKAENGSSVPTAGRSMLTCPAGKRILLLAVDTDVVASATVGNRNIIIRITFNASEIDWIGTTSGNTTAGQLCGYDIGFGAPLATPSTTVRRALVTAANVNVMVRETCSFNWLIAGGSVTIDDLADIDIADVLHYRVLYIEYDA